MSLNDDQAMFASGITLGVLAARAGLSVSGDATLALDGACALSPGRRGALTFADQTTRRDQVRASLASAAILPAELADVFTGSVIVSDTPRLTFARLAVAFDRTRPGAGVDSTAVIDDTAIVEDSAHVGAYCVVGAGAHIQAEAVLEAGVVIGEGVVIGPQSRVGPRACVLAGTTFGARVTIASGAVIGERGFGLVPGPSGLEPVPQLGGVVIGDDVEIGANTTVDRGALDDTRIETGVKIDNQVHIAHNCVIGAHSVIAGCTGIAGSSRIGRGCMIGGGVGIGDHVTLADGVTLTAASQVPKDIDTPGVYSSTFRAMPARLWRRRLALFRALDRIEARVKRVESKQRMAGDKTDD